MIAPQIFAISSFLSLTWGAYLLYTIRDYISAEPGKGKVAALRRFLVAFCLWCICFSYVFRTAAVLLGLGESTAGQISFFAIIGTNVVGSISALISLRYD